MHRNFGRRKLLVENGIFVFSPKEKKRTENIFHPAPHLSVQHSGFTLALVLSSMCDAALNIQYSALYTCTQLLTAHVNAPLMLIEKVSSNDALTLNFDVVV